MTGSKMCINPGQLWTGRGPKGIISASPGGRRAGHGYRVWRHGNVTRGETRNGPHAEPAGRRARQPAARPRRVEFSLTEQEYQELSAAAARRGLARGAYAADAALSAARGLAAPADAILREALGELIRSAGLVRRIG